MLHPNHTFIEILTILLYNLTCVVRFTEVKIYFEFFLKSQNLDDTTHKTTLLFFDGRVSAFLVSCLKVFYQHFQLPLSWEEHFNKGNKTQHSWNNKKVKILPKAWFWHGIFLLWYLHVHWIVYFGKHLHNILSLIPTTIGWFLSWLVC